MTAEHGENLMKIGTWPEAERRKYKDLAICAARVQPDRNVDETAESVGRRNVPEQFVGTPYESKAVGMMAMLYGCVKAHPSTVLIGAMQAGSRMGLEGADVWSYAETFARGYAEHQAAEWRVLAEDHGWDWDEFFVMTNEHTQRAVGDWLSLVPFACKIGLGDYFDTVPPEGWEPTIGYNDNEDEIRRIYGEDEKGLQIMKGGEEQ